MPKAFCSPVELSTEPGTAPSGNASIHSHHQTLSCGLTRVDPLVIALIRTKIGTTEIRSLQGRGAIIGSRWEWPVRTGQELDARNNCHESDERTQIKFLMGLQFSFKTRWCETDGGICLTDKERKLMQAYRWFELILYVVACPFILLGDTTAFFRVRREGWPAGSDWIPLGALVSITFAVPRWVSGSQTA
jgi:hypothetical protein